MIKMNNISVFLVCLIVNVLLVKSNQSNKLKEIKKIFKISKLGLFIALCFRSNSETKDLWWVDVSCCESWSRCLRKSKAGYTVTRRKISWFD